MSMQTLVNGKHISQVDACDRGLQYGDGLFETIAVTNGRVRLLQRHLDRLAHGCKKLHIPAPSFDQLRNEIDTLARDQQRAVLKIMITRGCGGRGYSMPAECNPTRILSLYPWPDYPERYETDGIDVHLCQTTICEDKQLSSIKHLNRLPQVLASHEWQEAACQEGFMFYPDDNLAEGTRSNVFLVKNGSLVTPALKNGGVLGIMRGVILEIAHSHDMPVMEIDIHRRELPGMEEIFICNSLVGIWPVVRAGDWRGSVGPVTRQLQQLLPQYLDAGTTT